MNLVIILTITIIIVLILFGINCNNKKPKEEFTEIASTQFRNDWEHFINKRIYIKSYQTNGGNVQWHSRANGSGDYNIKVDKNQAGDWIKLEPKNNDWHNNKEFIIKSEKGTLTTRYSGAGSFYSRNYNWLSWNGNRVNIKGAAFCPHTSSRGIHETFRIEGIPYYFTISNYFGTATIWGRSLVSSRIFPGGQLESSESGLYFANINKREGSRFYVTTNVKTYLPYWYNNGYCNNNKNWSWYYRGRHSKRLCEIDNYKALYDKHNIGFERCVTRTPGSWTGKPLYPTLKECKKNHKNWKFNKNTKKCYKESNVEGDFYANNECLYGSLNWDYDNNKKKCVKYKGQTRKYIDKDECDTNHKNWGLDDKGECAKHENKLKDYYTKDSCERNEKNTFYDPVEEKCITTERVKQAYYTKPKECEKKHKNWYVKDSGELSEKCVKAPGENKDYYTEQKCKDANKNMYIKNYQCERGNKEADFYNQTQCLTAKRYWVFKDGDCIKNDGVIGDYFTQDECYENNKLIYELN